MSRILAYTLSILFLGGFFWFDLRTELYDTAIPYFGAVLFALWSPKRVDVLVVSVLCLVATLGGGYVSIDIDQKFSEALQSILVERSLSIFALVCVAYVGWQRRGISIRLRQMNELLEQRVDISEKETTEIQLQLAQISSALDQHTVERREKERGYRETIANYQTLLETLPINVFQKNKSARLIFGNARYFETLGRKKDECIGQTDFDLFPKELAEKYHSDDQRVLGTGQPLELIEEHLRPDGNKIYVQVFKAPIRNSKNNIVGLQGMFWDVTDRIAAEQSQKEADARFRSLVNSNIIGIFTGRFDGHIVDANDEFLNLVGYSREELEANQLNWNDLTPPEFAEVDQRMEGLVKSTGFCRPLEKEYFHRQGRRIPVLVGAVRLDSEKDEAICSVVDITRQKDAERALQVAKDAADEANRSKSLFLANMSHEIRTPLNAIIGMTELVQQSKVSREQGEYLKMVRDSGEALLDIINDILDFSKLQAGKLKLEPVQFSLRNKIGEALRPLSIRAHEKSLKIVCDISAEVPDQIFGDAVCLRQVLTNLVSNSIKFTEKGEIVITVTANEASGDCFKLHVSVADTGPGIEADLQRRIFKEFEQADNTATRKYGGTGLGLAICSNLVQLMAGEIWVESEPGQGSTFHFTSMWEDRSASGEDGKSTSSFESHQVLLVDGHQKSLEVARKILERWDLKVDSHLDLDQAVARFDSGPEPYQILLVDEDCIRHASTDCLKKLQSRNPDLKTILLGTSLQKNSEADEATPPAIEVEYSLLKPLQESELFDVVAQALSFSDSPIPDPGDAEPFVPPLKILLAEDNLVNQRLATAILTQRNHEVQIASNGAEAISLATSQQFDLILMDIQMPNVDGIEATREIRKKELQSDRRTVIIALTAHAGESDKTRCLEAGMDGYVTKPLRPRELMLEVKKHIRVSEAIGAEKNHQENGALVSSPKSGDGLVNWDEALKQTANDVSLLKELIGIFEKESPQIVAEIEAAVESEDRKQISAKAHHLKGSFRVFACQRALDVAQELERLKPSADPKPIFARLQEEYAQVFDELIEFKNEN